MAWALVAHAVNGTADGNAGPYRTPHAGTVNTTGANLYVLACAHYNNGTDPDPTLDIVDVAGNVYIAVVGQGAAGDVNNRISWLYCVNPTPSASEFWTLANASGHLTNGGICALAFSGCAASPTIAHTESGATSSTPSAGSLGTAGDLVVTAVADYTAAVSSVDSSFAITDQSTYTGGNNIGIASAWCNLSGGVAGSVNPTWTMAAGPSAVSVQALSITGTGGGPPAGPTYPQLERGIRGLARGLAGGLARSFVRRDRIFVPSYAILHDLKAAA